MEVAKKKYLFIVLLSICGCFTGCNKTEMDKPYFKVNTDYTPSKVYYESSNKNEYNYTLENINDICSVDVSFEFYNNGKLEKSLKKVNEYTTKEKFRKLNFSFTEAYPIIKNTGENYIIFAIKNDNFTKQISIKNYNSVITDSYIETKDNFYLEEDIEYCLITFYASEKSDIKSINNYINRNDFLIDNYKYVYFVKIKYRK